MSAAGRPDAERRHSTRDEVRSVVGLCAGPKQGSGTVHDISVSGARIEYPTFRPLNDSRVELQFSSLPGAPTVLCEVTRQTETGGFCVQFVEMRDGDFSALRDLVAGREPTQKQRADRIPLRVRAGVEIGGLFSEGVIHDVSMSGARVEGAPVKPRLGAEVTVSFVVSTHSPVVRARGVVTRRTDTQGFAVRFAGTPPKLAQLLSDVPVPTPDTAALTA